jgi:hypothetical protein
VGVGVSAVTAAAAAATAAVVVAGRVGDWLPVAVAVAADVGGDLKTEYWELGKGWDGVRWGAWRGGIVMKGGERCDKEMSDKDMKERKGKRRKRERERNEELKRGGKEKIIEHDCDLLQLSRLQGDIIFQGIDEYILISVIIPATLERTKTILMFSCDLTVTSRQYEHIYCNTVHMGQHLSSALHTLQQHRALVSYIMQTMILAIVRYENSTQHTSLTL